MSLQLGCSFHRCLVLRRGLRNTRTQSSQRYISYSRVSSCMDDTQQTKIWTGKSLPVLQETGCVYLDYNATTPIYPEVAEAMEPYLYQNFGNPSSKHVYGLKCHAAVETARIQVAELIGCEPCEIFFTSCGTESNNWAIWGIISAARNRSISKPHVVTSAIEHPAVLKYLDALSKQGMLTYTAVSVTRSGIVRPQDIKAAIDKQRTVLISIMHSNNEVGAIQPIQEVAEVARSYGVCFHCDAAQSLGKVPVDVKSLGVDMLSIVGHKFGAPKGVAALYKRSGLELEPLLFGGGQEGGLRSGTENVLLIVGLGKACEIAKKEATAIYDNMKQTRDHLFALLTSNIGNEKVLLNGPDKDCEKLPNTLNISIQGLDASELLSATESKLAASSGSACHSGGHSVSDVLDAMKVPLEVARGTLRLSTGRHTTMQDIAEAANIITAQVTSN